MDVQEIRRQITEVQIEMNRISVSISNLEESIHNLTVEEQTVYAKQIQELRQQLKTLNNRVFSLEALLQSKVSVTDEVKTVDTLGTLGTLGTANNNAVINAEVDSGVSSGTWSGVNQNVDNNNNTARWANNYGTGWDALAGDKVNKQKKAKEQSHLEENIGKNVMGVLASLLIFIGLCSLGALVFENLGDVVKAGIIHLISFAILGVGLWRVSVNKNAFSTSLSAIGIGSVYIAIITDCILGLISLPVMGVMIGLWSVINLAIAYKYQSTLYTIISYIGFYAATTLGMLYYEDVDIVMLVLFCAQLLFNAVVLSNKFTKSVQFQNIISYIMLLLQWITMVRLEANYDIVNVDAPGWLIFGGIAVLVYLIYTIYSYLLRLEEGKYQAGFIGYLYVSLFLYISNVRFIELALPSKYACFLCVLAGLGLVGSIIISYIKDVKKTYGGGITVLYYIMSLMSAGYFTELIWEDDYAILGIILLSLFMSGLLYMFYKYRDTMFIHISSLLYFGISLFYIPVYVNLMPQSGKITSIVVSVLYLMLMFCGLLKCMYIQHNGFDKFMSMFGLSIGADILLFVLDSYNMLTYRTFWFSVITVHVLAIGFVLLTAFGTKWYKTGSLLFKTDESKYDALFYTYRVFTYLNMIILIIVMYDTDRFIELLMYTLYGLFLCCVNTTYILDKYKDVAGYLLGVKVTVYTLFMLDIYSGYFDVKMSLIYSIVCLLIAIASILIGFYLTQRSFRIYGLVLSIIAVLKLVLIDISYENSIARILGYMFGGILCLAIVLIYNKLEATNRVKTDANNQEEF